jgi:hypothetical protein
MTHALQKISAAIALTSLVGLLGCGEIDQKAKVDKVYAGKKDTRPADGDLFKGDKKKWESALAERNKNQNEYLRTSAKQP